MLDVFSSPVFSPLNSNSTVMAKQKADSRKNPQGKRIADDKLPTSNYSKKKPEIYFLHYLSLGLISYRKLIVWLHLINLLVFDIFYALRLVF